MRLVPLILIALFGIPFTGLAQNLQLASSAAKAADSGGSEPRALTLEERKIIPLFGELSKTSEQINEEMKFLSDCDKMFGDRTEASRFFSTRAWEYLQEGQLDTACYRFNLANLLDKKSPDPYWGLGVICFQQDKLDDAGNMLSQGVALAPENVSLLVDLSTVEIRLFEVRGEKEPLSDAQARLLKAAQIDPNYAQAHYNLSVVSYYNEDYSKAWEYLHSGRKIDFSQLNLSFVELLKEKMADPVAFFK